MKKICILLAFISLVSCCSVGCKKAPTQSSTTVQTEPIVEEKKITLDDIENRAVNQVRSSIKGKLLNPSSYVENSALPGTNKLIVITSSGKEEKRIYISVFIDYSAQNKSGGYNREKQSAYYYCSADVLEMSVANRNTFDLIKIDWTEYYEALENGTEF